MNVMTIITDTPFLGVKSAHALRSLGKERILDERRYM